MPVYLNCTICGQEFAVPPSRAHTAKACSKECGDAVRSASRRKSVTVKCRQCGTDFEVPPSHAGRRHYCSYKCRDSNSVHRQQKSANVAGARNPSWKGGRAQRVDGYVYRHVGREHPFSTAEGYLLEHRAVMEEWLRANDQASPWLVKLGNKLYLAAGVEVHHRDEGRGNNSIDNLECMTPAEHRRHHAELRRQQ